MCEFDSYINFSRWWGKKLRLTYGISGIITWNRRSGLETSVLINARSRINTGLYDGRRGFRRGRWKCGSRKCRSGKCRSDNVWKAVKQKIKILNILNFKSVDWAPVGIKHNRLAWFLVSESYSLRQTPSPTQTPSKNPDSGGECRS